MRYNLGDNVATNPSLLGGLKKIIATINKLCVTVRTENDRQFTTKTKSIHYRFKRF